MDYHEIGRLRTILVTISILEYWRAKSIEDILHEHVNILHHE